MGLARQADPPRSSSTRSPRARSWTPSQHPRQIDVQRVDAQQARRVLDRLVGYQGQPAALEEGPARPLGWARPVGGRAAGRRPRARERRLRAGRVLVDRGRPAQAAARHARLPRRPHRAGRQEARPLRPEDGEQAHGDRRRSRRAPARPSARSSRPSSSATRRAPFTTSTLQQEASRKLGFTARQTMAVAQQLYEGMPIAGGESVGLITYMRTDSVDRRRVGASPRSRQTDREALRQAVRAAPRRASTAPAAGWPRRPTRRSGRPRLTRTPESVRAVPRAPRAATDRLYDLIWKRFVASQMASAVFDQTTVDIDASRAGGEPLHLPRHRLGAALPRLPDRLPRGPGRRRRRRRGRPAPAAGADRPASALDLLSSLPEQHFTQPPPRYTEATLVKALEEHGIGRPSTYAPILSTIRDRGYVEMEERRFKPTDLGYLVNDLLVGQLQGHRGRRLHGRHGREAGRHRPGRAALGAGDARVLRRRSRRRWSARSARSSTSTRRPRSPTRCATSAASRWRSSSGGSGASSPAPAYPDCKNARPMGERRRRSRRDEICENCGKSMQIKTGRFGKFLSCSDYPECKTSRPILVKLGQELPRSASRASWSRRRVGRAGRSTAAPATRPATGSPGPSAARSRARSAASCASRSAQDKIHCMGCDGDLPTRPRKTDRRQAQRRGAGRGRAAAGGRRGGSTVQAPRQRGHRDDGASKERHGHDQARDGVEATGKTAKATGTTRHRHQERHGQERHGGRKDRRRQATCYKDGKGGQDGTAKKATARSTLPRHQPVPRGPV